MTSVQLTMREIGDGVLPGARIEGEVEWRSASDYTELIVSVFWYTEGRGTEDIGVVAEERIAISGTDGGQRVVFTLPTSPWSFSGRLITLGWAVEANLEPRGPTSRVEFVMAPERTERTLHR